MDATWHGSRFARANDAVCAINMKKRLLLVDDDPSVRQSVQEVLTLMNYEVMTAADGEEAVRVVAASAFDLVLLDLNMPRKNGWDTFAELTNDNPCLPVIIITARSGQRFISLGAGVGALMEKPLDFPKMLQTIQDLLAEPPEARLARMEGKPARFYYSPAPRLSPGSKAPETTEACCPKIQE